MDSNPLNCNLLVESEQIQGGTTRILRKKKERKEEQPVKKTKRGTNAVKYKHSKCPSCRCPKQRNPLIKPRPRKSHACKKQSQRTCKKSLHLPRSKNKFFNNKKYWKKKMPDKYYRECVIKAAQAWGRLSPWKTGGVLVCMEQDGNAMFVMTKLPTERKVLRRKPRKNKKQKVNKVKKD